MAAVPYYGDYPEDHAAIRIPFNTFTSDDPAASVTITNLVDADIKVHKDGGLTQISTDGASIIIDFDSIIGGHMVLIDSSVHADYSTGSEYQVRIEGTTVDGAVINAFIGTFSIERAGGVLALVKLLTAAGPTKTEMDSAHALLATPAQVNAQADIALVDYGANTTTPPTVAQIQAELEENAASLLDTIRDELANGVDGLTALKSAIDAIPTTVMRGTDSALLAVNVPSNFSSMGIEADGHVHADLKQWLGVAPLSLVSQRVNVSVGAMASAVILATTYAAGARDAAGQATDAEAAIADAILARNIGGGSDGGRTVQDALRVLRNKVTIAGGTMTVKKENDSDTAWTGVVTTASGDPISQIDPA